MLWYFNWSRQRAPECFAGIESSCIATSLSLPLSIRFQELFLHITVVSNQHHTDSCMWPHHVKCVASHRPSRPDSSWSVFKHSSIRPSSGPQPTTKPIGWLQYDDLKDKTWPCLKQVEPLHLHLDYFLKSKSCFASGHVLTFATGGILQR